MKDISALIRNRRSVQPVLYTKQPIPRERIEEILENANWAPTHRKTEPWRFKVFQGKALEKLSDYLGNWYEANTPEERFSAIKLQKTRQKPTQSACVIAICMQRDPKESLPEWEEIAAVACAVQNMWLTCTAYGIGSYWSSPAAITKHAKDFLNLKIGERCLGLFYMGYVREGVPLSSIRQPIADKVDWV
ncbi:MAG: nitroreductase [Bacteroidota bacterium]